MFTIQIFHYSDARCILNQSCFLSRPDTIRNSSVARTTLTASTSKQPEPSPAWPSRASLKEVARSLAEDLTSPWVRLQGWNSPSSFPVLTSSRFFHWKSASESLGLYSSKVDESRPRFLKRSEIVRLEMMIAGRSVEFMPISFTSMLPVSPVFHTVVKVSIGLKNIYRVGTSTLQY